MRVNSSSAANRVVSSTKAGSRVCERMLLIVMRSMKRDFGQRTCGKMSSYVSETWVTRRKGDVISNCVAEGLVALPYIAILCRGQLKVLY